MAHHVVVNKVPKLTKDQRLTGKYVYHVRCKKCGNLPDTTSQSTADLAVADHHLEASNRHHRAHPRDLAHVRVHQNKSKKASTRG